ncbi:MAG: succinylglutamate desuccinylase/aspartoacylase family protein [Chloroflexi bacterium]|nr:succinylglutamate desuccinylase/aspartoacylase family protein [Chloroflexota bacterium]
MTAERKVRAIAVPGHPSAEIPLIEFSATTPGPVVNIVGGLAGTAYPGIAACRMLAKRLPGLLTKGRVRIVPVVDVAGFYARAARFCPLDGRAVVGAFTTAAAEERSASDRIAEAVAEAIADADVHIDVRGGELTELHAHWAAVPPAASQFESLALAVASGADMRVSVDPEDPMALELGAAGRIATGSRAALIISGGGGVTDVVGHAQVLLDDLLRVLDALDVIDGIVTERAVPLRVVGPRVWSHIAESPGLWMPATAPGVWVAAGEVLGHIRDYFGEPLQEVTAPFDGAVLALTTSMAVNVEPAPDGDRWFGRTVTVAEASRE